MGDNDNDRFLPPLSLSEDKNINDQDKMMIYHTSMMGDAKNTQKEMIGVRNYITHKY